MYCYFHIIASSISQFIKCEGRVIMFETIKISDVNNNMNKTYLAFKKKSNN